MNWNGPLQNRKMKNITILLAKGFMDRCCSEQGVVHILACFRRSVGKRGGMVEAERGGNKAMLSITIKISLGHY